MTGLHTPNDKRWDSGRENGALYSHVRLSCFSCHDFLCRETWQQNVRRGGRCFRPSPTYWVGARVRCFPVGFMAHWSCPRENSGTFTTFTQLSRFHQYSLSLAALDCGATPNFQTFWTGNAGRTFELLSLPLTIGSVDNVYGQPYSLGCWSDSNQILAPKLT
jgi:hypothetical protein